MSWRDGYQDSHIKELVGQIFTKIENSGDEIIFHTNETKYKMYHSQECCEYVSVEEIIGDLEDLIGSQLLQAEVVSSSDVPTDLKMRRKAEYEKQLAEFKPRYDGDEFYPWGPNPENGFMEESETWTFYKLATIKGSVTIRWYGKSNGYYSESVDLVEIK